MKYGKTLLKILSCLIFLVTMMQYGFAQNMQHQPMPHDTRMMHRNTKKTKILNIKKIIPSIHNNIVEIIIVFNQQFNPMEINRDIILINRIALPENASVKYNKKGNEMSITFDAADIPPLPSKQKLTEKNQIVNDNKDDYPSDPSNSPYKKKEGSTRFFLTVLRLPNDTDMICRILSFDILCGNTIFFDDSD
ncbi:MAG: hypothetical protein ACRC5H_01535 [Treponemataceae bacterium]